MDIKLLKTGDKIITNDYGSGIIYHINKAYYNGIKVLLDRSGAFVYLNEKDIRGTLYDAYPQLKPEKKELNINLDKVRDNFEKSLDDEKFYCAKLADKIFDEHKRGYRNNEDYFISAGSGFWNKLYKHESNTFGHEYLSKPEIKISKQKQIKININKPKI